MVQMTLLQRTSSKMMRALAKAPENEFPLLPLKPPVEPDSEAEAKSME
jgi:hypothetical protein